MPNKGTTGTIFITSLVGRVLDWGLNPGHPTLEASTIPLGYRVGGARCYDLNTVTIKKVEVSQLIILTLRLTKEATRTI